MSCCKTCFVLCDPIPSCLDTLSIVTPSISASITLRIIDRFNKIYYITKNSDITGKVDINLTGDNADLPIGFFNEFAGYFKVLAYNSSAVLKKWTIDGSKYDAIAFKFTDSTYPQTTYTIDPNASTGKAGDFNSDFNQDFFI